jgi:hypothetical protein
MNSGKEIRQPSAKRRVWAVFYPYGNIQVYKRSGQRKFLPNFIEPVFIGKMGV